MAHYTGNGILRDVPTASALRLQLAFAGMEASVALLARFSRMVSEVGTAEAILPLLADAVVEHVGAEASAILRVTGDTVKIVASCHLPAELASFHAEADELGSEIAPRLLAAAHGRFVSVEALPMISHGSMFGVVAMFFGTTRRADELGLAEALVDLAATALGHAVQLDALQRAHDDLQKAQRALVQAEKLRALGQMAGGIAHDLNNVLNPLSLHAQIIERSIARGQTDAALEAVWELRATLARGVQTVQRLRDYGRRTTETNAAPIDLDSLAEEGAAIAKPRLASSKVRVPRISLELGKPPPVLGQADEVLSAIVNLTINAIDAMKDIGGTVTIETGTEDGRPIVRVRDTGPGMPPEIEAHVFEPFFSTKGDQGTGLGLAMVYACMQHHGGKVDLVTAPGKGTVFTLRFPAS